MNKKQQLKEDIINTFHDVFMDKPKAKEDITNEEIETCNKEAGLSIKDTYMVISESLKELSNTYKTASDNL